jgi:serine protease Do
MMFPFSGRVSMGRLRRGAVPLHDRWRVAVLAMFLENVVVRRAVIVRQAVVVTAVFLTAAGALATDVSAADVAQTIDEASEKVVKIFGAGGRRNLVGYGSGFLISPDGYLVTVWNHLLDGDEVTVVLHDGRRFSGRLVGVEPPLDLAVLKIDVDDVPYFDLSRETATAGVGTRVLAFSNVFKVATGDEPVTVMHGVVSARTKLSASRGTFRATYQGPVYVVDAITNNSGAAGGVLTNQAGELLGVLGKELRDDRTQTWLNYVIPIGELTPTIQEIVTQKFASRANRPDPEADEALAAPRFSPRDFGIVLLPDVVAKTPAFIDRVIPESPADRAGLQPDDLIVFFGSQLVPSCRVLLDEFRRLESGGSLRLVVRRGDALVTVDLPVPVREEESP